MALNAYADTSALVKLLLDEPETPAFRAWLRTVDLLMTSRIGVLELYRIARRIPGTETALQLVLDRLAVLPVTEERLKAAEALQPPVLRSVDAVHLATASSAAAITTTFACYDLRLGEAARKAGLEVVAPR